MRPLDDVLLDPEVWDLPFRLTDEEARLELAADRPKPPRPLNAFEAPEE